MKARHGADYLRRNAIYAVRHLILQLFLTSLQRHMRRRQPVSWGVVHELNKNWGRGTRGVTQHFVRFLHVIPCFKTEVRKITVHFKILHTYILFSCKNVSLLFTWISAK